MRPIKFRAWDGKEMSQLRPVWFEEHGVYDDDDFGKCAATLGVTLMQFTGLHDKNGREIYEGDILRPVRHELGEDHRTVTWEGAAFYMRLSICGVSAGLLVFGQDYTVIGNIHENPELLK